MSDRGFCLSSLHSAGKACIVFIRSAANHHHVCMSMHRPNDKAAEQAEEQTIFQFGGGGIRSRE